MSDSDLACSCLVDTHGLYEVAGLGSGNLKSSLLEQIADGVIGVPSLVWSELKDLYPEEAAVIEHYLSSTTTIGLRKRAYTAKAGLIAERLGSGFSVGPYNNDIEIQVAAIATVEKKPVLTVLAQISHYEHMGCRVMDLDEWVSGSSMST